MNLRRWLLLAGVAGFEPTMRESKSRALTAWPHPYVQSGRNINWGEWWDSNPRPPEPQSGILTS